jgi:hypothetical protein
MVTVPTSPLRGVSLQELRTVIRDAERVSQIVSNNNWIFRVDCRLH